MLDSVKCLQCFVISQLSFVKPALLCRQLTRYHRITAADKSHTHTDGDKQRQQQVSVSGLSFALRFASGGDTRDSIRQQRFSKHNVELWKLKDRNQCIMTPGARRSWD